MRPHGIPTTGNPWSELPEAPPYVLACDRPLLDDRYIDAAEIKLHCLPVPYVGDPWTASVVFLALNPGWRPETDALETGRYAELNRLCLTHRSPTPFFSLDSELVSTPGYQWWAKRLRLLIEEFGIERVRSAIACVEWFPYHSATFRRPPAALPSQDYGFRLVAAAARRGAAVVVMRSRSLWLESVPELHDAQFWEMKVPRSPYVTPGNLTSAGFEAVRRAVATAS